jgi:hypothetical protein
MTNNDTQELLAGLLRGANINQLNILTGEHAHVSYHDGGEEAVSNDQQQVVDRLKPLFFGVEEEARAFFTQIQGMKATQITAKVNQLVVEKKISDMSQHRDLWTVLHDCGLYDKSESNWNQQVR